ncbi:FAD-binding protein [Pseudopedobacter beijingensis]|uniref:FAD-binding protein n=1 Tax=Pseudopedobacter beijingensis TaxID=1207056 RepID=A0ABW4IHI8_9SPHI
MKTDNIPNGPIAIDKDVDVLIVGSGTGMIAALAGDELGLKSLIIEKTSLVGGSTARSGGAFWIPANPILKEGGSKDTLEKAEAYLGAIVKDAPKKTWMAFLNNGVATVELLRRATPLDLFWAKGYSDYHPENPGGDSIGRTCESRPFNINSLGAEVKRLRPAPMSAPIPMPVTGYDYKWMNLMLRKPLKAFPIILKAMFKGIGGLLFGKKMTAGGEALAAGLFRRY